MRMVFTRFTSTEFQFSAIQEVVAREGAGVMSWKACRGATARASVP